MKKIFKYAINSLIPLAVVSLAPLVIQGCQKQENNTTANTSSTAAKTSAYDKYFEEAKNLNYFTVGGLMSAKEAYVFFDPQCPHCGVLWRNSQNLKGIKINWIPVAFINQKSLSQGAVIVSSPEGEKLMNIHEELLLGNMGGIQTNEVPEEGKSKVQKNTAYFGNKFESVPAMLYKNSEGKVELINGEATREVLLDKLGIRNMQ